MELDNAVNNLDNVEQIDSELSALSSIDSEINVVDTLDAEMLEVVGVQGTVDAELSLTSKNAVQNSVITAEINEIKQTYATKDFVEENGGKIDSISVNGAEQEIKNKNVNIVIPEYATNKRVDDLEDNIVGTLDDLNTQIQNVDSKLGNYATNSRVDDVENIAKGANQAVSFADYSTMVDAIKQEDSSKFGIGQNIMIVQLNVPDLWISGKEDSFTNYNYTNDSAFLEQLSAGRVKIGYYYVSALETQKVDLTNYREKITNANKLYATDESGNQTEVVYGRTTDAYGIVQRGAGGQIAVADAKNDDHATNLGQVNSLIEAKYQDLESKIENAEVDAYTKSETDALLEDKANKSEIPSIVGLASETYVNTKIADLVNSAPETLDTLGEVAQAIKDNESVVDALNSAIGSKADKDTTYTKTEVDEIKQDLQDQITTATGGEYSKVLVGGVYQPSFDADTKANASDIPTKTSQLTNDSGFLKEVPSEYVTETELTNKSFAKQSDLDTTNSNVQENANAISSINSSLSSKADKSALDTVSNNVNTIQGKIPTQASETNQLADKEFVNSSISTATATFRGTVDSVDSLPTTGVDINDYAFVRATDSAGNTLYQRYKYNGSQWVFEYELNNSSFTSEQWSAINSGVTESSVTQINTNKTNIDGLKSKNTEQDTEIATKVSKNGDTMTGALIVNSTASANIPSRIQTKTIPTPTYWVDETNLSVGDNTFTLDGIEANATTYFTCSGFNSSYGSAEGVTNVKLPITITFTPAFDSTLAENLTINAPTEDGKIIMTSSTGFSGSGLSIADAEFKQEAQQDIVANGIVANNIASTKQPISNNHLTRKDYVDALWKKIYPIGAIYVAVSSISPASFLGGTWEKLPEGYALWTASSGAGTTISAGLPNITGTDQTSVTHANEADTTSGAFSLNAYSNTIKAIGSGSSYGERNSTFDASKSNSIYGNSDTVQPPAYKIYAWKRVV